MMIPYGLGTITFRSKHDQDLPETPTANINISVGLSREEYDKLLSATSKIGNIKSYLDLFSTIRWNFEDLVSTLADIYATISYYLQYQEEADKSLEGRRKQSQVVRQENEKRVAPHGIRTRLMARKHR